MAALADSPRAPTLVLSPDDEVLAAARAVVRFQLSSLARVEAEARAGETEPVHQLRVATRRLRAALRLFRPQLAARFAESTHRELAWLAGLIGAVRDLDVLFEAVRTRAARLDPELRKELGPVGIAIHDERATALAALAAALDSARCRRVVRRLGAFTDSPARRRREDPLGRVAPRLIAPLFRAVRRAGRRLSPESPPAEFHRLRVRVKRLRYALETLRGLGGKPVRRVLARLEELQDLLGAAQDAVVHVAWLHGYSARPASPAASLLPVGALIQALARRGEKRRRRSLKAWRRLDDGGLLEAAIADIGQGRTRIRPAPVAGGTPEVRAS
jgi:CHAD domain-containing protein